MERSNKRMRGLSTDYDESDDRDSSPEYTETSSAQRPSNMRGRPRRGAPIASSSPAPSVTIDRTSSPAAAANPSIRLNIKMPTSKLRQATSGSASESSKAALSKARDPFQGGEIINGPRGTRAKKAVIIESDSDEEDDVEEDEDIEEGEDEDEDAEGDLDEDVGNEMEEDEEEQDEEEDEDAEGEPEDIYIADAPLPPPVRKTAGSKPTVTVTPAPATSSKVKSVEAKEMQLATANTSDDEELSDIDSEDEDAEGEEIDDEMNDEDDGEGEDDAGGDSDSEMAGSRGSTPDISKMTKRQRSRLDQVMGNDFLQLPMEPQIKKHLTAEEHAMRRAEMARRRKNLSEKRNEEEKMDTINRLLKKQAPKRRGKISAAEVAAASAPGAGSATPAAEEEEVVEKADPVYVRWVSNKNGARVGVPGEWAGKRVGKVFDNGKPWGRLIEEVET